MLRAKVEEGKGAAVPCWPAGWHVMGCQGGLNKVSFELRTEGGEGESCGDFWGKGSQAEGIANVKVLGQVHLVSWRNSKE